MIGEGGSDEAGYRTYGHVSRGLVKIFQAFAYACRPGAVREKPEKHTAVVWKGSTESAAFTGL